MTPDRDETNFPGPANPGNIRKNTALNVTVSNIGPELKLGLYTFGPYFKFTFR